MAWRCFACCCLPNRRSPRPRHFAHRSRLRGDDCALLPRHAALRKFEGGLSCCRAGVLLGFRLFHTASSDARLSFPRPHNDCAGIFSARQASCHLVPSPADARLDQHPRLLDYWPRSNLCVLDLWPETISARRNRREGLDLFGAQADFLHFHALPRRASHYAIWHAIGRLSLPRRLVAPSQFDIRYGVVADALQHFRRKALSGDSPRFSSSSDCLPLFLEA